MGRASKLTPETRAEAIKLARLGFGVGTIARYVGVDRRTVHRWRERDPSFRQDLDQARVDVGARVVAKLLELIDQGNIQAIMFFLRNRFGEDFQWSAKNHHEETPPKVVVEIRDRAEKAQVGAVIATG